MRVGVNHQHAVDHDADVALPKNKIAPRQPVEVVIDRNAFAEFRLLHVGIARRDDARCKQRRLNEPRAIEPDVRPSTPEIRRADIPFRDLDEIARIPV